MKRWLVWTCSGLAAAGLLALVVGAIASSKEDRGQAGPGRPAPSTPAAASFGSSSAGQAARIEALKRRLATDDRLKPPPANASREEWKAYEDVLAQIEQGDDPLKKALPSGSVTDQRLADRRKKGEERRAQNRKKAEEARARDADQLNQSRMQNQAARAELGLPPRDYSTIPPSTSIELPPPIIPDNPDGKDPQKPQGSGKP